MAPSDRSSGGAAARARTVSGVSGGLVAALALGFLGGRFLPDRAAAAADPQVSFQSVRMISLEQAGRALVVDQSNRLYLVDGQTGVAKEVEDTKGNLVLVR